MLLEIVAGSIGISHALDPSVAGKNLGVPAVLSVMSHLISKMLTETKTSRIDSDLEQEHVTASHIVSEGLIGNNPLRDSTSYSHFDGWLSVHLIAGGEQSHLVVGNLLELGQTLVCRINEMLNLAHCEFTNTDESLTRRDLVTESKSYLGSSEGQFSLRLVE